MGAMGIKAGIRTMGAAVALLGLLAACAGAPARRVEGYTPAVGEKAADTAQSMIGRPYKFTGDTPAGFDCSGLVRYSYLTAGMDLPHGTKVLMTITRSVGIGSARKGDLLFFLQEGKKYSHVGIYVGDDQFVHAPSTGGKVRRDSITDPYWKKHYLDTRRFL
jgi:cell wall-associated NlpC family hydrolase